MDIRGDSRVRRVGVPVALVGAAVIAVAGCTSTVTTGPGSMMGDGSYHFSPSRCSAPASLAGQQVRVMLGDMGMTSMMGGVAPMGARMMLRAHPGRVAAGQVTFVAANRGWRTHELVVLPLSPGAAAGHRYPEAQLVHMDSEKRATA